MNSSSLLIPVRLSGEVCFTILNFCEIVEGLDAHLPLSSFLTLWQAALAVRSTNLQKMLVDGTTREVKRERNKEKNNKRVKKVVNFIVLLVARTCESQRNGFFSTNQYGTSKRILYRGWVKRVTVVEWHVLYYGNWTPAQVRWRSSRNPKCLIVLFLFGTLKTRIVLIVSFFPRKKISFLQFHWIHSMNSVDGSAGSMVRRIPFIHNIKRHIVVNGM